MAEKIRYSEFRFSLVEGGEFVALWPKNLSAETLKEIRELFDLQMASVEKAISRRTAIDALGETQRSGDGS